jgi:thiamine phosphate synthase YjbQ (UPF0047 family)
MGTRFSEEAKMNGRRIAKLVHEGTVPARNGELLLGTWQEIYPWEHRTGAQARRVVDTVVG